MPFNLTNKDIGTRYALQEDFNNGFVGRDRQVVIQTDDPKGYRPVIMDGVTQGGKSKVALVDDLSDYVSVSTYNSDKEGFETTDHASATYATKSELSGYLPISGGTLTGTVNGVTPSADDNSTKLATTAYVQTAVTNTGVPAGTFLPFAGTAVPDGYLLCNGAEVSRTDYANLFAAIGTKWGEGDGSTTFTLPNFNDRFIEGTTDTEKVGQYLEAGAPNITGTFAELYGLGSAISTGALSGAFAKGSITTWLNSGSVNDNKAIDFMANLSDSTFGASETIQPQSGYVLIIIKE